MGLGRWMLREPLSRIVLSNEGYGAHTAVAIATTAMTVIGMPWQLKLQFEERATAFVMTSFFGLVATLCASLWFVVKMKLGALGALSGKSHRTSCRDSYPVCDCI